MATGNLFDSSRKTLDSPNSTASHRAGETPRGRAAKAITHLEACLQAKLSDVERTAYLEFLCSIDTPGLLERTVRLVVREFKPERSRLPMPSEFLEFMSRVEEETESLQGKSFWAARYRQWQDELDREDQDDPGGRERAKGEFKALLRKIAGRPNAAVEKKRAASIARQRVEDRI